MAGKPGRSGGHNRKSLAELQLSGTVRAARHLALPIGADDPVNLHKAWKGFLRRLATAKAKANWNPLDDYARQIMSGAIPAGKYHRLACARHLRDVSQKSNKSFPYRLDLDKVARFLVFVKKLRHYKGQWAGHTIKLQPHQVFRLGSMFGWVHVRTGLRRYRRAYHELPRKNGKSLEAAIVALYVTFFDGEGGADGYCAATKKDQAKIVWGDAAQLVKSSILKVGLEVFARSIFNSLTMSKLEPLGSDSDSTDGLNPHLIIQDEFHAYKDRKMIDVLETATGARQQPVDMRITTAGDDPVSPGGDEHNYACQVLEQVQDDESYFAFIAHADPEDLEGDKWMSDATARKANPNYGVSVKPDDLTALALKAKNMPAAAAAYQQKRLNVWVNTSAPWLSLEGWRKGQHSWTVESMHGEECWIGVDLSSKIDLTAIVLVFPPTLTRKTWRLIVHALTPDDTLEERAHRDRAPYLLWRDAGLLRTNPGNRIDQDAVRAIVGECKKNYLVQQVGIDPWNAGNLVTDLVEDGFDVVEIPQTLQQMSAPAKDFEADVLDGLVDAGGNPLMAWCISNVVVHRDGKDNIYPVKKKSRGRIDPVIAALMGRKLASMDTVVKPPSYSMLVLGGGK
jgi:phage terminase large subunit-like protein